MTDSIVNYFAYGCNMASSVRHKRKIEGYEIIEGDCYIKDYALTFDYYGLPLIEPSFGNIQPSEGCEVHGIVIKMPYKDFMSKVVATEGTDYQVITVKCGERRCVTLHNPRPQSFRAPSERYLNFLLKGAKENRLCNDYRAWMENIPSVTLTKTGSLVKMAAMPGLFLMTTLFPSWCCLTISLQMLILCNPLMWLYAILVHILPEKLLIRPDTQSYTKFKQMK